MVKDCSVIGQILEIIPQECMDNNAVCVRFQGNILKAIPRKSSETLLKQLKKQADHYWCLQLGWNYMKSDHDDRSFDFKPMYKKKALENGLLIEGNNIIGFLDYDWFNKEYICIPIGQYARVHFTSDFSSASGYFNESSTYHCITAPEEFSDAISFMRDIAPSYYMNEASDIDIDRFFSLTFDSVSEKDF